MATPDKGISADLLSKVPCVVVVPGLKKLACVIGGEYGFSYLIGLFNKDSARESTGSSVASR